MTRHRRPLDRLGRGRLVNFLRADHAEAPGGCLAVALFLRSIDDGEDVETLLDGDTHGYYLDVHRIAPLTFRIGFGCIAGPLCGDGQEREVEFDAQGNVLRFDDGILLMF